MTDAPRKPSTSGPFIVGEDGPEVFVPRQIDFGVDPAALANVNAKLDRLLANADRVEDRLRELESKVARLRDE